MLKQTNKTKKPPTFYLCNAMLIFTVQSYCLLKSFFLTVIRGERKEKVMFMHGNIKKFTIYETHNKAANTVTAIGQGVFSYTVLLLQ